MVVNGGWCIAAAMMSSNPSTEISSGTRNPASRSAEMAPMALTSLKAKIAVKRCLLCRSCRVTSWPGARARLGALQLNYEAVVYLDLEIAGRLFNRLPAQNGI